MNKFHELISNNSITNVSSDPTHRYFKGLDGRTRRYLNLVTPKSRYLLERQKPLKIVCHLARYMSSPQHQVSVKLIIL